LRAGQGSFRLALDLDASGVADRDDDPSASSEMRAFWKARPQHHLLRAYGPGRNLSEYIDKRYADRSPHVQAVMTLFDPLTQVASAEAIVEKADDAGFLDHLLPLVNHLFQDLGVTAIADGASLRFASQGATLAAVDLPDGLRATLAWVADLCFAWYALATPEERAKGSASMRATVLVDEIDLHLHPKLQRTLVTRLRERLPRVQWIVTTHSPLVLASFDREEIVLLEPDPEHGVRRRPLDRQIMGFTLDEIVSWRMETAPHSAALDAVAGAPVDPEERLAFLLSLSPTVGEREAREALRPRIRLRNDVIDLHKAGDRETLRRLAGRYQPWSSTALEALRMHQLGVLDDVGRRSLTLLQWTLAWLWADPPTGDASLVERWLDDNNLRPWVEPLRDRLLAAPSP